MFVSMWMQRKPLVIAEETSISEAALAMTRGRLRHLLIGARSGTETQLLGIVSTHEIARAFPPDLNPFSASASDRSQPTPVADIMTREPLTVGPQTPIEDAAIILRDHQIGALPVVRDTALLGVIAESDIFRAFVEILRPQEEGVRVSFDVSQGEDALALALALAKENGLRLTSMQALDHDGVRIGVVRLISGEPDRFIDGLWRSGHRVLSVERTGKATEQGEKR